MKKKLRKALGRLLDREERRRLRHRDDLKVLLKKLKRKQAELEGVLAEASGRKRKRLRKEIEVIKAQRQKGREVLLGLEES